MLKNILIKKLESSKIMLDIKHTLLNILCKTAILSIFLSFAIPAIAATDTIKNANWEKVPGTEPSQANIDANQYDEPAFLNTNGIIKKGGIVMYDIVNPDASYARLQTNCQTKNFRTIRVGQFISDSKVEYQNIVGEWGKASELYHILIVDFVCSL
ncbi:hypothetical protein [Anabaena sphaerica]|uniref:hypothetical protein n=1 Tax=Anabaena sphaerica TaxID=212446 RepID=UPI0016875296|nr:hypothetical protein [Anabaena sphaerica]